MRLAGRVVAVTGAAGGAFLLSDDALIIRGQSISVDGGDTPCRSTAPYGHTPRGHPIHIGYLTRRDSDAEPVE